MTDTPEDRIRRHLETHGPNVRYPILADLIFVRWRAAEAVRKGLAEGLSDDVISLLRLERR